MSVVRVLLEEIADHVRMIRAIPGIVRDIQAIRSIVVVETPPRTATKQQVAASMPVGHATQFTDGSVLMSGGDGRVFEPDGRSFSREDFPELYAVISDAYGDHFDDGPDRFVVPDLRGRVLAE